MKNRSVFARSYRCGRGSRRAETAGQENSECGHKKAISVVMKAFCILTVPISTPWLAYLALVLQDISI